MNPGMRTQGQSMASVTQTGTAAPGTVLYDSAKQGAGMVPGQSMVAGGQEPLANVAANKVGATLGPGMASNVITQGTSAGVGATQGVTNATMGGVNSIGRTMTGGR